MNFKRHPPQVARRRPQGFTLIEVLVVLGITSLLTGMVLTYSSRSRIQIALYVESAKISQVILKAKSLAIATYNNPDVPCGYGVHVDYDAKNYSLFSYKPTVTVSGEVRADCAAIAAGRIDPTNSDYYKTLETFTLPNNVDYAPRGAGPSADPDAEYVLFIPPDPKTYIWKVGAFFPDTSGARAKIQIMAPGDPGSSLWITISSAGQITF